MEKVYYAHFDVMKGIAISMMVMGHVMLFTFGLNPSEPSKFIYFNMPLFFYISGYLAYKKIDTVKKLGTKLLSRGRALLVPYVVFLILYGIFSGQSHIANIIICGGGCYWFLYDLFFISAFFLVYEYLVKSVKRTWVYVGLWLIPLLVLIAIKLYVSQIVGAICIHW